MPKLDFLGAKIQLLVFFFVSKLKILARKFKNCFTQNCIFRRENSNNLFEKKNYHHFGAKFKYFLKIRKKKSQNLYFRAEFF